jgi:hypothetical protein
MLRLRLICRRQSGQVSLELGRPVCDLVIKASAVTFGHARADQAVRGSSQPRSGRITR